MGFVAVAVEAGRYAITQFGRTTFDLGSYVVDGSGVGSAVGTAVIPSLKDGSSEALASELLAKEMRAINLMLHNAEAGRWLSLCR